MSGYVWLHEKASAFPPKADMLSVAINVCFVPKADMAQRLPEARRAS